MHGLGDDDEVREKLRACLWLGMSLVACGQTTAGGNSTAGTADTTASAVTSGGMVTAAAVSTNGPGASSASGSGADGGGSSTVTNGGGTSGGSIGSGDSGGAGGSETEGTSGAGEAGQGGVGGVGGTGGAADLPGFDDLIIYSTTMSDYEGHTVYVAYDHNLTPDSRSEDRSAVITSGAFEVVWEQGYKRGTFGAYGFLFVDLDGDATCTEAVEPVWSFFVNDTSPQGEPLRFDFDLSPERTVSLMETDCQRFVEGL